MIAAVLRGGTKPSLTEALGWIGSRVDDIYGTGVGRLEDVWIDPGTGAPRWLLVREGRFGGRTTLIPFEDATAGAGHVWIPYERDAVRHAPAVEPGAPLTQHVESALRRHFAASTATAVSSSAAAGRAGGEATPASYQAPPNPPAAGVAALPGRDAPLTRHPHADPRPPEPLAPEPDQAAGGRIEAGSLAALGIPVPPPAPAGYQPRPQRSPDSGDPLNGSPPPMRPPAAPSRPPPPAGWRPASQPPPPPAAPQAYPPPAAPRQPDPGPPRPNLRTVPDPYPAPDPAAEFEPLASGSPGPASAAGGERAQRVEIKLQGELRISGELKEFSLLPVDEPEK